MGNKNISRRTFIKLGALASASVIGGTLLSKNYLWPEKPQPSGKQKAYKTILHAYREDFPLMGHIDDKIYTPDPSIDLSALFDNLILDVAEFSTLPVWSYIARHTDDSVQDDVTERKKNQYSDFVKALDDYAASLGKTASYNLPAIWFVAFSQTQDVTDKIKEGMNGKNISYREQYLGEIDDLFNMPPDGAYSITEREGRDFYRFLNQTTQIGIDLLKSDRLGVRDEFKKVKVLETRIGVDLTQQTYELQNYLHDKSGYYNQHIYSNLDEYARFWDDFTVVHIRDGSVYSWPHFLFNILGA